METTMRLRQVLTKTLRTGSLPLFLLLLAAPQDASGQQPQQPTTGEEPPLGEEVTVVLEGVQRGRFRLAFPSPDLAPGLSPAVREAARALQDALRFDLRESRIFQLQGPGELSVLQLSGDPQRDFEMYRSLGNEMVLLSDIKEEASRLVLEARLFDLRSGDSVLGKRYRGSPEVARRIAHTFADEVVLYLSGRRGVALTSVAFVSDRSSQPGAERIKEIYLVDYDGYNERPITAHRTLSMAPEWSPTGQELAYLSYFSGTPAIYLADLKTGRKTPVVTDGTLNISPSFSPDGRRIAFARSVGGGNTEIFVVGRDGSGLRQLTHSPGIDTNPAWSPTGREIAFTSSRSGSPQIYLMDAEGANLRRISMEGSYNDGAAWSPDGTRIVYASRRNGGGFAIATSDVVTLESRLLASHAGSHESPSFSPDGRKIAFLTRRGAQSQIFIMDSDGANLRQLTHSGNNEAPSWSSYPR
jgi:TolB protein